MTENKLKRYSWQLQVLVDLWRGFNFLAKTYEQNFIPDMILNKPWYDQNLENRNAIEQDIKLYKLEAIIKAHANYDTRVPNNPPSSQSKGRDLFLDLLPATTSIRKRKLIRSVK